MTNNIKPLFEIFKLNTRLFNNCLVDVTDENAQTRLNEDTNNIAFIVCHIVDARYFIAEYIGIKVNNPFQEQLKGAQKIDQLKEYPKIKELQDSLQQITDEINKRILLLTDEQLRSISKQKFPVDDNSLISGLAFLLQHESYHIGQLAFLGKYLGIEAMKYS